MIWHRPLVVMFYQRYAVCFFSVQSINKFIEWINENDLILIPKRIDIRSRKITHFRWVVFNIIIIISRIVNKLSLYFIAITLSNFLFCCFSFIKIFFTAHVNPTILKWTNVFAVFCFEIRKTLFWMNVRWTFSVISNTQIRRPVMHNKSVFVSENFFFHNLLIVY